MHAIRLLLCAIFAANIGCVRQGFTGPASLPPARSAIIFISADLLGTLEPCGCSEAMRGGLDRAAFQITQARHSGQSVLYLDGGDTLFERLTFPGVEVSQVERRARAIAEIFHLMGLNAHTNGELDDARGSQFRKSLQLPEVADGAFRVFELDAMKIAVVAATTADQLLSACRSARAQASFVVGLIHQSIEEAAHTASLPGLEADLLVAGHVASDEPPSAESRLVKAPIPVIRIQSKGRSLARIDLFHGGRNEQFNLQNSEAESQREIRAIEERIALMKRELNAPGLSERLEQLKEQRLNELVTAREALASRSTVIPRDRNTFSVRFIPLESTLPRAPQATAQVEAYDRDVGLLNLAWAHEYGKDCPTPISGQASFVGNPVCRECHEESFPIWERSKHSRAYQTLAHKGKQYDLDCVGCHVTGFGKPGGVCRVDRVEGRQGVGCESCHGPGSQHSDNPTRDNILAAPRQPGCIGCHNPENSTHFDFDTYLPAILGPGHGLPKLKERQLQR